MTVTFDFSVLPVSERNEIDAFVQAGSGQRELTGKRLTKAREIAHHTLSRVHRGGLSVLEATRAFRAEIAKLL